MITRMWLQKRRHLRRRLRSQRRKFLLWLVSTCFFCLYLLAGSLTGSHVLRTLEVVLLKYDASTLCNWIAVPKDDIGGEGLRLPRGLVVGDELVFSGYVPSKSKKPIGDRAPLVARPEPGGIYHRQCSHTALIGMS